MFISIVQVQFAVYNAGPSLGVDALRASPLRCEGPDLDSFSGAVTLRKAKHRPVAMDNSI